jgi:ADP-glucose pyrophosphorylase
MATKTPALKKDDLDFEEFLEHIAQGLGYAAFAQKHSVAIGKLYRWIDSQDEGRARVDAAQEQAAQMYVEKAEAVLIAAQEAQALAKHYQWMASKHSKKYADRTTADVNLIVNPIEALKLLNVGA